MKRTPQVFLLVITTAFAVNSVSALEGSREIPARVVPVPDTVSPAMQAAIGAPPPPIWNTHPKSADEWKAFVQQRADVTLKRLPLLREQTGVKVEPTAIGGVKAFIITPREVAEGNRERVLVHVHGGGYCSPQVKLAPPGYSDGRIWTHKGYLGGLSHAAGLSLSGCHG